MHIWQGPFMVLFQNDMTTNEPQQARIEDSKTIITSTSYSQGTKTVAAPAIGPFLILAKV